MRLKSLSTAIYLKKRSLAIRIIFKDSLPRLTMSFLSGSETRLLLGDVLHARPSMCFVCKIA